MSAKWRGYFRPAARPTPAASAMDPCVAFGHREVWDPGSDTSRCVRCEVEIGACQ